jgi:hypothetical protein
MSQPRRRRRRGRRGGGGAERGGGAGAAGSKPEPVRESAQAASDASGRSGKSRRRRTRSRAGGRQAASPKSSEDLVRALPRERPETLTAEHDGQTLEAIIGDLQSTWGVPPYPQEYRITIKVAEERESRGSDSGGGDGQVRERSAERPAREKAAPRGDQPRREKAPAAPGITQGPGAARERPPRKRRRRRRRGGGSSGGEANGGSPNGGSPNGGSPDKGGS